MLSRRDPQALRFVSWNLGCPSAKRLARQIEFLSALDADVVALQEVTAEAGVALQSMRSGHMNDTDWRRLALRSSELADAPLFIDDSPNLTMMEIRAKARRWRAPRPRPAD